MKETWKQNISEAAKEKIWDKELADQKKREDEAKFNEIIGKSDDDAFFNSERKIVESENSNEVFNNYLAETYKTEDQANFEKNADKVLEDVRQKIKDLYQIADNIRNDVDDEYASMESKMKVFNQVVVTRKNLEARLENLQHAVKNLPEDNRYLQFATAQLNDTRTNLENTDKRLKTLGFSRDLHLLENIANMLDTEASGLDKVINNLDSSYDVKKEIILENQLDSHVVNISLLKDELNMTEDRERIPLIQEELTKEEKNLALKKAELFHYQNQNFN